ncbi:hypothetical protein M2405_001324 [Rhodococcus erythropolis]|nr:hypothetical protein [Rhodococcus erythropolis]MCW2428507.1 hypothetical protein [Rhodococcus erythropolis]
MRRSFLRNRAPNRDCAHRIMVSTPARWLDGAEEEIDPTLAVLMMSRLGCLSRMRCYPMGWSFHCTARLWALSGGDVATIRLCISGF